MPTSHSKPRCLITGCELTQGNQIVHGDLHEVGDCYIFNACRNDDVQAAWHELPPELPPHIKVIVIGSEATYFERHGVFTFHKSQAVLNPAAQDYINKWK